MATKTFDELKQLAIQIRDEKTNKQNTATRVGTEMLEHLNKLEQDYYDKTTINNRTSEYNVSLNHPTSGLSGSNKYDLSSAIAQVPAELRTAGLTVSFLNESGDTEKWEFSGGSWAVGGFSQVGAGKLVDLVGTFNILPRPTDLNTIVQRSVYPMLNQTEDDTAYLNTPLGVGEAGILIVYENEEGEGFTKGSVIYQIVISVNKKSMYIRTKIGSSASFSAWVEYKDFNSVKEHLENYTKNYTGLFDKLERPADLNNIVQRGTYPMYNQLSDGGYDNCPVKEGERGVLIVYTSSDASVIYQMIVTGTKGIIYTRSKAGSSFSNWVKIESAGTFTALPRPTDFNTVLTKGAYPTLVQTSDNGYSNVPEIFSSGKKGILKVEVSEPDATYSGTVIYQTFIIEGSAICTRTHINESWSNWTIYKPYEKKELHYNLVSIFRTIGVIADSLASGQGRINSLSSFHDFYEFSWPQCIARELNVTVYNFTKSGLTTRSWLTDNMGYPLMSDGEHNCTCYIIALGANDVGLGESYLGSPSDIDLENYENNKDTYYGNYAKIISLVKKQEPRAKIFVVPNPSYGNASLRPKFNEAVKYMETIFDNVYYVDIDESLYNDNGTFIKQNLVASHYTPAAYQYIASYIMSLMSDIIYNNPSEFFFVNLIGTEYQDPQL